MNHKSFLTHWIIGCLLVCVPPLHAATFNVLDYGAVGDDKTDNTAAFAKCMEAIIAAGGGRMFLPDGIYHGRITINLAAALQCRLENVFIHTGVYNVQSAKPVHGAKGLITPTNNNAALTLLRNVTVTGYHTGITVSGKHGFSIAQLNIENPGPLQTGAHNEWQKAAHDLNDPNNLATGDINWWVVLGNAGAVDAFTRNGASGIRTRRIGSEP
jgi:polygalacturonase